MSGEPGDYGILTASEIKEGRYENYERDICFRKKKSVVKDPLNVCYN